MQFSLSIVALVASALSVNAAGHSHLHQRVHARDVSKRGTLIQANSLFQTLSASGSSDVAKGSGLAFKNSLINNSTEDAKIYFWTGMDFSLPITASNPQNSAPQPLLIVELPAGTTQEISFSNNFNGAYAAVFEDTGIGAGGQWATAWVEVTTFGQATMDVSFLPNMNARLTSVEMPGCMSDISVCSYQCKNNKTSCVDAVDVDVPSCEQADFPMSNIAYGPAPWGQKGDAWNGGCQMQQDSTIKTTFS